MDCQPHLLPMKRSTEDCASGREHVLTPTFPNRDVKLLDLPSHVLGRIAALASGAKSKPTEPILDFQVTFDNESWQNLNSLRACCRQLRDASRLAVGGLSRIVVGGKEVKDFENIMPFETAISISWSLVKLSCVSGKGILEVIKCANKLAEVEIYEDDYDAPEGGQVLGDYYVLDVCQALALSKYDALKRVHLSQVYLENATILLSSLRAGLKHINIEKMMCDALLLSEDAKSTVEELFLVECSGIDRFFVHLSTAPNLHIVKLSYCRFTDPTLGRALRNCANLHALTYEKAYPADCYLIEKTIAIGTFTDLEVFEFRVNLDDDISLVVAMLTAIGGQLRKLRLVFGSAVLIESDIEPLSVVKFRADCDIALEVLDGSDAFLEDTQSMSVSPIRAFSRLRSLKIHSWETPVEDLTALAQLTKLERVVIFGCRLNPCQAVALAHMSRSLIELTLEHCLLPGRYFRDITTAGGSLVVSRQDLKVGDITSNW
eukprot:Plantae.Rhodophyta-Hildenbrandia_rubra.ctg3417.p1 GENE.Plantae.Rhodophyta-Hildenbrandia_rubra.ctg3417~~Plantae.Rhodophyta-Hildenbrandia_rubra.ctg3417.p1  ORF type:complete len:489 (-),score=44.51 Plantae.Rhodophyta-Hildenbrandia_rubra.ctg3417:1709-3175(-)